MHRKRRATNAVARFACKKAGRKAKLVNAAFLAAQSVEGAFAIVKTARRESLGIIKRTKIWRIGQIAW